MKENHSGDRRKNLQEKGYYIVLLLCVIAVGVSGYILVSTSVRRNTKTESLSVPLTAEAVPQDAGKKESAAAAAVQDEEMEEVSQPTAQQLREEARKGAVHPVKGAVQQEFSATELSYNTTTQDWRLHSAVDIAAEGQTVYACMAGTVTEVYEDDFLGTTVVICHDGGYETRYSNLTVMPTVKVGDMVAAGDTIGTVGSTAILESAQEPHLHFELLVDGVPVDPAEVLG